MTFDGRARGVARINPTAAIAFCCFLRECEPTKEVTGKKKDKDAANRGRKFKGRRRGEVESVLHFKLSRLNNIITVK